MEDMSARRDEFYCYFNLLWKVSLDSAGLEVKELWGAVV